MAVVQINQVPSNIKPFHLQRIIQQFLPVTRFYLRPREMKANNEFEKDGEYEMGFFETPDRSQAVQFVDKFNGKPIDHNFKVNMKLRGFIWSLTVLNESWEAANENQRDREQLRDSIFEHEMTQLNNLNRQYMEQLLKDKKSEFNNMTADEIAQSVPQIPYVRQSQRDLARIKWIEYL